METIDSALLRDHEKRISVLERTISNIPKGEKESTHTSEFQESLTRLEREIDELRHIIRTITDSTDLVSKKKNKQLSVREFLETYDPKSLPDKALSIAYFKEVHEQISPLTIKNLEDGFREAKEPLPKNLSDTIYQNIKKGYLMESRKPNLENNLRTWELTNRGIKYVEEGVPRRR